MINPKIKNVTTSSIVKVLYWFSQWS